MITTPFFTNFIKISNFFTVFALIALVVIIFILKALKKRKVSFSNRVLIGLAFGLVLGVIIDRVGAASGTLYTEYAKSEIVTWYSLLGSGFLRLIQLLAVPVVFLSILEVISNVKGNSLKGLTAKTFTLLLGTTAIAALVGVLVVNIVNLDATSFAGTLSEATRSRMENIAAQSFPKFFLDLIPSNIVSTLGNNNSIVSVVIIGALFAVAIRYLSAKKPEEAQLIKNLLTSARDIVSSVLANILKAMPYGIVALVTSTIVRNGVEAILGTLTFIVALYLGVIIMLGVYVIILLLVGLNPITFFKKSYSTMVFAFSSRSSVGTLPYTIDTLENKLGVSKQTSNFVATLGTTIGMNGCAGVFPAMLAVVLAKATGVTVDVTFLVLLVLVVTVGSIGIAGVPGTSTVSATVTLNGIGLGNYINNIGAIFGIDPIIDMGRTMLNVTGAMMSSVVVDKWENNFNKELYNK